MHLNRIIINNIYTSIIKHIVSTYFQKMPQFLKEYKNPCFYSDKYRRLRCVPYFIIAGFPKAGSTDLWHRLIKHPDIIAEHFKELNFYHKKRLGT